MPLGLGHHGRKLAGNVGQFRQLVQILLPGCEQLLGDFWLGEVIEDEGLLGELLYQLYRDFKVPGKEQQVIGEVEFLQLRDATAEVRPQHEIVVGFVVDYVAHANELGMRGKAL